jgi:hypothetical protein
VESAIEEFGVRQGGVVLDRYCGAGDGLLAAKLAGRNAVGMEANPFLRFVAKAKTRNYPDLPALKAEFEGLIRAAEGALEKVESDGDTQWRLASRMPAMPKLQSWVSSRVVWKVLALQECIEKYVSEEKRDLPLLALASVLKGASHMRLSPHAYGSRESKPYTPVLYHFDAKLRKMLADLEWQETQEGLGKVEVAEDQSGIGEPADLAVAAPPILGDHDPTVQTRIELFFLGHVKSAAELDNLNSCVSFHEAVGALHVAGIPVVQDVANAIEEKSGNAEAIRHYFDNLLISMRDSREMLAPRATLLLSLGESVQSGVHVPLPDIAADLGREAGYSHAEVRVQNTRRHPAHKGGLKQSVVVLRKD